MRVLALAATLVLAFSSPALAWDPFADHEDWSPPSMEPEPDPYPYLAPPPGIYYVTDTYVADVVTTSGPLTTYATTTVHESTGSYARVLESVATGSASAYDGAAFNGRRSLADGRVVAGTYYENYVLTQAGFVPVSVVFFQDDAEIARLSSQPPATPPPPAPTATPKANPVATAAPACCGVARPAPVPIAPAATPAPPPLRPVISLIPSGAPLGRVEVLRGRPVALWLRAFAGDTEIPVRSWTVVSGELGEADATSGAGATPFRTSWPRMPLPDRTFDLLFRIEVGGSGIAPRSVDAAMTVVVRSPALER